MKRKFLLGALYLLSHFCLQGQDLKRVREYIDTLAAPGMHGRGYINKGDKIAALYLENQFNQVGLLSFESSGEHNYFQYFNFDINTFPNDLFLKFHSDTLTPGKDFIAHPASGPGKGCLKTYVIDTSIFGNSKKQKKFLKLKANKYVLIIPQSVVLKNIKNLPPDVIKKIYQFPCVVEFNSKLTASLSTTQSPNSYFQVRNDAFDSNILCNAEYIIDVELKKNYESQNVIGYIKGKQNPDSFIVISAHYDHLGRMGKDVYFPGANDNASGISMLLELARFYSMPENKPECSIAFMAFGAEEAGLIGSEYYTRNPYFPLKKIKFLINLDLMGTGDEGITAVNATLFPYAFNLLTKINEEKKYLPAIKKRGSAANSDHYHFTQKGVPAFFLYTMGGIAAYHDIYDRRETLPLTKFCEVFLLLTDFIKEF